MHSSRNWILAAAVAAVATLSGASLQGQAAATICKDGTTSISSGRGACSGHGGVNKKAITHQKKIVKNEVKAAQAVAKRTPGAQVTTLCVDGTTSNSTGRGTCSGHGGAKGAEATSRVTGQPVSAPGTSAVPRVAAGAGVRAGSGSAEDNNPAGAIARCKDGLYSHSRNRRGACSRHGGVGSWM